jgi:hypothetical protein
MRRSVTAERWIVAHSISIGRAVRLPVALGDDAAATQQDEAVEVADVPFGGVDEGQDRARSDPLRLGDAPG